MRDPSPNSPSRADQYKLARKLDPNILGRICRLVFRYRTRVGIAVLVTVASSGFQLFIPRYLGEAVDNAQGLLRDGPSNSGEIDSALWFAAAMILALSIFRGLFAMLQNYLGESLNDCIAADLRKAFYRRLQLLDLRFHDSAHTGDLITRGMLDLEGIRHFPSTGLVRSVMLLVLVTGGTVLLISTDVILALISLSFVPIIAVRSAIARMQLRYLWLKQQERLTVLTNAMEENLTGIRIVRAFAAQAYEILRFDRHSSKVRQVAFERLMARVRSTTFMTFTFFSAMTLALWVGGNKVIEGQITVGTLIEFLAFMMILQMPVRQIGMTVNSFARASTCGARFFEIIDYPSSIESTSGLPDLQITNGELRFQDVSFHYGDQESPVEVVAGISFRVGAGKTLAIIGAPGSGKSTIARLIPRFYEASSGRILIDGQDIRSVSLSSLRRAVGGVQQDSFLFTASIDNNIAYGNPWSDSEMVQSAGNDAQLDEFIASLPDSYETLVGERGVSLSGGQRQRVSIARGHLVSPPICILDDATAAIDAETEVRIRAALMSHSHAITTIIISHRLVSVMHADEILFLEQGRIIERGTHSHLIALKGRYFELHALQMQSKQSTDLPLSTATST